MHRERSQMIPKNFSKILHCQFSYQTLPGTPFRHSYYYGEGGQIPITQISEHTWGGGAQKS